MNIPNSVAAPKPQPAEAVYSADALALFKTFARDTYFAEFGVQAPPWDPARPRKAWFDSAAVDAGSNAGVGSTRNYSVVGQNPDGSWGIQALTLTAQEAATVNLPGAVTYLQYQPAPTKATRAGQPITAIYMMLEEDARALMAEVGGTGFFDEGAIELDPIAYPAVVYPASEQRRIWAFKVQGQQYYAGLLLASKCSMGIGWPGHWDFSRGYVLWVPDPPAPTGVSDSRPVVPVPVRNLLPNEKLQAGPMGFGVTVVRTDLNAVGGSTDGFTASDRATLQRILEIVAK